MRICQLAAFAAMVAGILALAAPAGFGQPPEGKKDVVKGPGGFGPGGPERKLVKQFDKDQDKRLNAEERKAAREHLKADAGRGFGPKGGFGMRGQQDPPRPGPRVKPGDVMPTRPEVGLFDPAALRTLLLEFENADWEAELADFHNTDVEVPCTLTVDGKRYPNVGVHFRGMSSYMGVGPGHKRSLNLALDFADKKQRLYGAKTLNLLNSHADPSFLSTVLYSHVARQYIPAPKANLVKVVINGESWGLYVNAQQFDREFVTEHFKTDKGARWKVSGSPGGGGGLEYIGENVEEYRRRYEMKSGGAKDWKALVNLCKVLNQTPPEKLEEALKPIVDLDGLLWFLALDVALINNDGYWIRASDYGLYLDPQGKFHLVPHDMNEAFRPAGGPGFGGGMMRLGRPGEVLPGPFQDMLRLTDDQRKQLAELQKDVDGRIEKILTPEQRKQLADLRDRGPMAFGLGGGPGGFGPPPKGPGGPGGFGPPGGAMPGPPPGGSAGGVDLDPLVGLTDARKPLRGKLLAVPALRARYLQNVRTIAEKSLDWKALGPVVARYRGLIDKEVEADTRKLGTTDAFRHMTADTADPAARGRDMPLRAFADQRRKYLLDYKEPKAAGTR